MVIIVGTNDVPTLAATTAAATEDGQTVSGALPGADVDSGTTLTYGYSNVLFDGLMFGMDSAPRSSISMACGHATAVVNQPASCLLSTRPRPIAPCP